MKYSFTQYFFVGLISNKVFECTFLIIITLVICAMFIDIRNVAWVTYTNPLMLEFVGGMVIARFKNSITPRLACVLLPIGLLLLGLSTLQTGPRVIMWGVPAFAIITGAVATERWGFLPSSKLLLLLGNSSYSIYLFQVISIDIARNIIQSSNLVGYYQFIALILLSMVMTSLLGIIVHLLLERRIVRFLAKRRAPARSDVLAAP